MKKGEREDPPPVRAGPAARDQCAKRNQRGFAAGRAECEFSNECTEENERHDDRHRPIVRFPYFHVPSARRTATS